MQTPTATDVGAPHEATEDDSDLDAVVRRLLESNRGRWPVIVERSGVSHSWLSKFVRNEIPNPGINTLKKIRDVFKQPPPIEPWIGVEPAGEQQPAR